MKNIFENNEEEIFLNKIQERLEQSSIEEIDIKEILITSILKYLTDVISFKFFVAVISELEKSAKVKQEFGVYKTIIHLHTLSQYASDPEQNKEFIIDALNKAVEEIETKG